MSPFPPPTRSSPNSASASTAPPAPAGWYADPIVAGQWRWWDGRMWTQFASAPAQGRKPRLPRWLSVPVLVAAPLVVISLVVAMFIVPLAVLAGAVPILFVWPVVRWLDRVEPEPLGSRIHAVLWGASVAILISLVVEVVLGQWVGEAVTAVITAPLIEEATKGLGIVWAVRRREVDGTTDGVVYGALVALGFAVVEDIGYLAGAGDSSNFLVLFIVRSLLSPFAHPLFTMWTGLAIGRQVRRGRPLWPGALWGYGLAVAGHMAWNGAVTLTGAGWDIPDPVSASVLPVTAGMFFILFVIVAVTLARVGRRERQRFVAQAPVVAARLGFPPADQVALSSWKSVLSFRRSLPRSQRRTFDDYHAAVARLTMLNERSGAVDPAAEAALVEQARAARQRLWPAAMWG